MWSFAARTSGSAVILPDGRCDIIVRNHANTPDQITPIITGPATKSYRVDYDTGDQWFGIRLRPEHGATLWQGHLAKAPDSVLRGQEALDHLPSLCALRGSGFYVYADYVSFEFAKGVQFEDPNGVLEGTEKFRRHVKLHSAEDIKIRTCKRFLDQAVALSQTG